MLIARTTHGAHARRAHRSPVSPHRGHAHTYHTHKFDTSPNGLTQRHHAQVRLTPSPPLQPLHSPGYHDCPTVFIASAPPTLAAPALHGPARRRQLSRHSRLVCLLCHLTPMNEACHAPRVTTCQLDHMGVRRACPKAISRSPNCPRPALSLTHENSEA